MISNKNDLIVSILCPVYNQAQYVRQCIDSVLAQKTSFLYEILINDDASSDGSADIVREYADKYPALIKAICQNKNQFSQGVDIIRDILLPKAQGRYIAICEGDDWWINPNKIQHQVEIMEKNPDCGLVYTYFYKYNNKEQSNFRFHFHEHEGDVYPYILSSKCTIWYVTVMMRKKLMLIAPHLDTDKYFTGDVFWYYWLTLNSKTILLKEFTSVYRVLDSSVSHFIKRRKKIDFFYLSSNTRLYFAQNYPPKNIFLGAVVKKKSKVNIFKYALSHGDYILSRSFNIPLFPIMSLKKLLYFFIHLFSRNHRLFKYFSKRYNQYLDNT